jgi:hypothetical protein
VQPLTCPTNATWAPITLTDNKFEFTQVTEGVFDKKEIPERAVPQDGVVTSGCSSPTSYTLSNNPPWIVIKYLNESSGDK